MRREEAASAAGAASRASSAAAAKTVVKRAMIRKRKKRGRMLLGVWGGSADWVTTAPRKLAVQVTRNPATSAAALRASVGWATTGRGRWLARGCGGFVAVPRNRRENEFFVFFPAPQLETRRVTAVNLAVSVLTRAFF